MLYFITSEIQNRHHDQLEVHQMDIQDNQTYLNVAYAINIKKIILANSFSTVFQNDSILFCMRILFKHQNMEVLLLLKKPNFQRIHYLYQINDQSIWLLCDFGMMIEFGVHWTAHCRFLSTKDMLQLIFTTQSLMGNITAKIVEHKYQLTLVALGVSWVAFLQHLRSQNQELRMIANSIDPQIPSISKLFIESPSTLSLNSICDQFKKYKKNPIYRIALTGGPCAGKSTALESIEKHFTKSGFKVLIVPQVPTIVGVAGGLSDFGKYNTRDVIQFQTDIIKFKIYFEDYITRLAEMNKSPCLILCDRGIADCAAYMSRESYQAVLDEQGWTWSGLRDKRYDSVIFMNTAADGAEEYYTLANNAARHETAEEARALDKRTLNAWIGHPYMTICPNIKGKPFQYKVDLAIKAVQKTIGLQSTDIIYHKYLVEVDRIPDDVEKVDSQIEQIYLRNQNPRFTQDKIKKRGQDNSFTYQRKFVGPYNPNDEFREVVRTSLNSLQYATLHQEASDPQYRPIQIKRTNFSWNNTYFSLDRHDYIKDYKDALLLRFEAGAGRDPEPIIPPWIKPIRDVRLDIQFTLSSIARKQY